MLLIVDRKGRRLCYDNCLRGHANFGGWSSCVKVYQNRSRAINRACKSSKLMVVAIPKDCSVNAAGQIYNEKENRSEGTCLDHIIWQRVLDSYENGECPDCGETIPIKAGEGEECANCGHVFWLETTTE